MIRLALRKLKQWTSFPTVKQPPQTLVSSLAKKVVFLNVALALSLYALLGDNVIALVSIGLFVFAIMARRITILDSLIKQRGFLLLISLGCIALFLIRFNGSIGGRSWMGLLALLTAIKVFETKELRDYFVAIIMLYFFTAIIFSYHNSALAPVFLALFSVSTAAALMLLSSSNTVKISNQDTASLPPLGINQVIKKSSWLFAQALPITILLFFLFPRIQGTFGFLPDESSNLNPGFGDSMSAGDFRERSFSDDIAFRTEFTEQDELLLEDLYWRVKTLSNQKGLSWSKSALDDYSKSTTDDGLVDSPDKVVSYRITHQPTSDSQLPSLETVASSTLGVVLNNDSLMVNKDFSSPFQYDLTSNVPGIRDQSLGPLRGIYLQTTSIPKRNTRKLINRWLVENDLATVGYGSSPTELSTEKIKRLSNAVLEHFRNQPFKYHLLPPELDESEVIEDFLFRTRSGYCEHYASTYSTLMRWMGVPSRIVVGYQGGEFNEQGGFFEVRYSNAHAWSEIWTNDEGWIRVDPTAAVAPERIEFGMDALLALMSGNQEFSRGQYSKNKLADALNPTGSKRLFKSASQWFSSANHSWDKWVVNYGFEQQKELLEKLGLDTKNQHAKLMTILGIALAVVFAVILFFIWPRKVKLPPVDAAFHLFKEKLRKHDVNIPINEGPQDLETRLCLEYPKKRADIRRICQYYIQSKYQNDQIDVSNFTQLVKQFRLHS